MPTIATFALRDLLEKVLELWLLFQWFISIYICS